jgi:hypothetical protein
MADLGRSPDQRVKAEIGEAWPQPRFFVSVSGVLGL